MLDFFVGEVWRTDLNKTVGLQTSNSACVEFLFRNVIRVIKKQLVVGIKLHEIIILTLDII